MSCARTRRSVGPLRWTWQSTCSTAYWSWDARTMSASPDPKRGWGHCARSPDPCNTASRATQRTRMSEQPAPLLFLSHAGADTEAARRLKQRIEDAPAARERGLRVWFDKDDLGA